jgi:hypothetical protein
MASEPGPGPERRQRIEAVIAAELQRQAASGAARIDVGAMASAIDAALAAEEPSEPALDDGRRPDELNATNDD